MLGRPREALGEGLIREDKGKKGKERRVKRKGVKVGG